MAITVELVYQALFLSSIFLMAISLPKIVIYVLWSVYRVFIFEHAYGWKSTRMILSEKAIQDGLTQDKRFERLVRETETYTKELKKPMIELLSALVFLHVSSSELTVEAGAAGIISALQTAMVLVIVLAVANLVANFLRMRKIRGGGPLV